MRRRKWGAVSPGAENKKKFSPGQMRELICRANGGDEGAEEALYRDFVLPISTAAAASVRYVPKGRDLDDLVADAALHAMLKLKDFKRGSDPYWWIYTMAQNYVRDVRRRELVHTKAAVRCACESGAFGDAIYADD
jgi:DNA-directed RNA polymerase specialized sigma24 family protein